MLLPKPIRKFIAVFRGGVSPLIIVLSIMLGLTFGLIPGFYGVHALILLLFILLNIHFGLFFLSGALAKGLCYAAAPLLYHVGGFVQAHLSGLLSLLGRVPVLGLTDFSRYAVAAGLVVGPIAGLVLGLIMVQLVMAFRRSWLRLEEGSEAFRKWNNKGWVRMADRIIIGKRAKDVRQALEGKNPIIRKAGVALAVVVVLIGAGAAIVLKDEVVTRQATAALTRANRAEVNVGRIDLSLARGQMGAADIQVTDPENPQFNQLSVGTLSADARLYDLSCGKVVINEMLLSEVRFDTERQTPGKVLPREKSADEPFDPDAYKVPVGDLSKLETYFENAKKAKEFLDKLRQYLPKPGDGGKPEPEQVPHTVLEYLQARAVTSPTPRVLAKRIVLDKVELPNTPFGTCKIIITNVSDAPAAAGLPAKIEIQSEDNPEAFVLTVHFDSADKIPAMDGVFNKIDLSKFQSQMSDKNPVVFKGGTASGGFKGTATAEALDLNIAVNLQELKADSGGKGMLGLDAKNTSEVLAVLKNLETTLRLVGPPSDPRIVFDSKGLTGEFQKALADAGKDRLNQELQKQLDGKLGNKIGDKLPAEVKEVIKDPAGLIEGIGGLLGGRKKE
ncbi:MAG: hypothetical protein IH624_07760 [Phycisphaerae bacterium]|nr:hypothetical protein [Phycisphaerae bacterium]